MKVVEYTLPAKKSPPTAIANNATSQVFAVFGRDQIGLMIFSQHERVRKKRLVAQSKNPFHSVSALADYMVIMSERGCNLHLPFGLNYSPQIIHFLRRLFCDFGSGVLEIFDWSLSRPDICNGIDCFLKARRVNYIIMVAEEGDIDPFLCSTRKGDAPSRGALSLFIPDLKRSICQTACTQTHALMYLSNIHVFSVIIPRHKNNWNKSKHNYYIRMVHTLVRKSSQFKAV